jgi:hypothetical protein
LVFLLLFLPFIKATGLNIVAFRCFEKLASKLKYHYVRIPKITCNMKQLLSALKWKVYFILGQKPVFYG